jgi:hypothetical protein
LCCFVQFLASLENYFEKADLFKIPSVASFSNLTYFPFLKTIF